jgi:hypothetical protein
MAQDVGPEFQTPVLKKKKKDTDWLNGFLKETYFSWVLIAHTCNPSYSGGRDQEDCGSTPAQPKRV